MTQQDGNPRNGVNQGTQVDDLVQKLSWVREHLPGVWFEATLSGTILAVSPRISRFSSHTPESLEGRSLWNLYPNPLQREELLSLVAEHKEVVNHPIDLLDHDGSILHVRVTATFIINTQGLPYRIFGFVAQA